MISGVGAELPRVVATRAAVAGARDEALAEVYRSEYVRLVGLARLLIDDRAQAEEVVQEAFARTYAAWDRMREHDHLLPYVRRVVVNLARDGQRRRAVALRHPAEVGTDDVSAETSAIAEFDRQAVAAAVRRLPERQRQCVALRFFLDCSTAETAETLGISEGAVKTHLHRALATLGINLEGFR